jgi:hypothetical protein
VAEEGELAQRFVVDTGKAQQMSDRLKSVGKSIEGFPPGPQPRGPLGKTGALERAWSEFERSFAAARQNLARSISGSASGFAAVVSGANNIDQQKAQEAKTI